MGALPLPAPMLSAPNFSVIGLPGDPGFPKAVEEEPRLFCVPRSHLFSLPLLFLTALPGPQAGLIRTDNSDYFIEPLERGQQLKEAGGRTHVVYRREAVQREWTEPHGDLHNEGRL